MKILYASYSVLPSKSANSVHVSKMSDALYLNGHVVNLCGLTKDICSNKYVRSFYSISEEVRISRWFRIPGLKNLDYLIFLLFRYISFRPELIYTRSVFIAKFFSLFGTKVILELHSELFDSDVKSIYSIKRSKIVRIVTISTALKKRIMEQLHFLPKDVFCVEHDGVPTSFLNIDAVSTKLKNSVGYIGSLNPGKGVEFLCSLAHQLPDVEFHIIGGNINQISELKKKFNSDNIHFHGHLPTNEAQRKMREMMILVMPYMKTVNGQNSKIDISKWMSPLKLFEYLASGIPIVTSDLPVIREVVDSDTVFFAEPDSLESWTGTIRTVLNDYSAASDKATKGKDIVSYYTWEARCSRIIEQVRSLEV
ncbi:MAG TPA: hypothetical protein DCS87_14800 [Rheinheimera sp.]|nr:hypothetical protein [Rheinheimera sp.]